MSDKSKSAAAGTIWPKVVIERTYRAQAEELWDLWTTKTGFESWWGPEGFRVEVALALAALVAAWIPSRRAMSVEPAAALRAE